MGTKRVRDKRPEREREGVGSKATGHEGRTGRTPGGTTRIQRTPGARFSTEADRSTDARGGYAAYNRGPDREELSARYGIDVGEGEARELQRLESEFGSDRVGRWADEGMSVETMGRPRDMQAFREDDGDDSQSLDDIPPDRAVAQRHREEVQLVDVRSATAYRKGHIPGAVNVPAPELAGRSSGFDVARDVALYCRSGQRSRQVAQRLAARADGPTSNVFNVRGGFEAWAGEHGPGNHSPGEPIQAAPTDGGPADRVVRERSRVTGHKPADGASRSCGCGLAQGPKGDAARNRSATVAEPVQARLELSSPGDPAEREARRVAERVMRTTAPDGRAREGPPLDANGQVAGPMIQRSSGQSGCSECEQHLPPVLPIRRSISRTTGNGSDDAGTEENIQSATSGGKPLPESTRSFFEPRFGRDFSDVRIHTGSDADEAARSINAEAFTVGSDIVFAKGNYEPGSDSGRTLLAHELTHVVQQGAASGAVRRAATEESTSTRAVITVRRGDTLSGIAERARQRYDQFDGTYNDLWAHNEDHMKGDSANEIYPGEKVYIPGTAPDGGVPEEESPDGEGGSPDGEAPEEEGEPEDEEEEVLVASLCHRDFRAVQNHVTDENKETMRENLEAAAEGVPLVGEDEVDTLVERVWDTIEKLADQARHCFVWVHPADTPKSTPQSQSDMEEWTFTYDTGTSGHYDEGALGSDVVCTGTFDLEDSGCVEAGYSACDTDDYNLGLFNCCSCAHQTLEEACGVSTSPGHFPPQNQGIGLPENYGSSVKRTVVEAAGKLWKEGADAVDALWDLYNYYF